LGELTREVPKPMVCVAGRPFLDYLLDLLVEQGFERVTLLLGYRAETVIKHVDDGRKWGIVIDHVVTPPDVQTLTRLRAALPRLDPIVLMAYCDNYVPLDFPAMWDEFTSDDAAVQVTAYANDDGFTRNNMLVDERGRVMAYDPSRTSSDLNRVDLGFAIIDRQRLGPFPRGDLPFEHAVYSDLVRHGRLRAHVTSHRYYGVGSASRLPAAERFFSRCPAVILDRDGVLNRRAGIGEYVTRPEEFVWLEGARKALRMFTLAGIRILIVTNQAGIARGIMTHSDLDAVHGKLLSEAAAAGGTIDRIYHCPHGWDDGCKCRKPAPGMLLQAQRDFDLDLSRTVFVGDTEVDRQAAIAAGCKYRHVDARHELRDVAEELMNREHTDEGVGDW